MAHACQATIREATLCVLRQWYSQCELVYGCRRYLISLLSLRSLLQESLKLQVSNKQGRQLAGALAVLCPAVASLDVVGEPLPWALPSYADFHHEKLFIIYHLQPWQSFRNLNVSGAQSWELQPSLYSPNCSTSIWARAGTIWGAWRRSQGCSPWRFKVLESVACPWWHRAAAASHI